MAMNSREKDTMVKALAVEAIADALNVADSTRIDDFVYVVPVSVEGEDRFAKITVTSCLAKDTKTNKAFNLEDAIQKYADKVKNREAAAAEAAAKKAAKAKKTE